MFESKQQPPTEAISQFADVPEHGHSYCDEEPTQDHHQPFKLNDHVNDDTGLSDHGKKGACKCGSCDHCLTTHINVALTNFLITQNKLQLARHQSVVSTPSQDFLLSIETPPPILFS